jgi:hypothetical protein
MIRPSRFQVGSSRFPGLLFDAASLGSICPVPPQSGM